MSRGEQLKRTFRKNCQNGEQGCGGRKQALDAGGKVREERNDVERPSAAATCSRAECLPAPGLSTGLSPDAKEESMSTTVFLIIFIVLGVVVLAYFNQRSKNFTSRHPGEKNPIDFWLYGKDRTERTDRKDDDES